MTRNLLAALAVALPLTAAAAAPKPFEGTVTMTMKHDGQEVPGTWSLKGKMARMEMQGGPHGAAVMIVDGTRQVMIMLMAQRKMYMEMPMVQPAAKGAGQAAKVVKTGRTEKILGFTAAEYRSEDENGTTEVWAAKGLGMFSPMGGGMRRGPRSAWEDEMVRGGLFPLRMVHKDKAGVEKGAMTVTAINAHALDDSLFAPPADYQKFSIPAGMPAGMGAGMGAPPAGKPAAPAGGGY